MTLCPYAIVAGCSRCPVVRICPAKGVIGDHSPEASASAPRRNTVSGPNKRSARAKRPAKTARSR